MLGILFMFSVYSEQLCKVNNINIKGKDTCSEQVSYLVKCNNWEVAGSRQGVNLRSSSNHHTLLLPTKKFLKPTTWSHVGIPRRLAAFPT